MAQGILEHDIKKSHGLKEFIRCRIRREEGKMRVESTGTQSSGVLRSLSLAQGLIVASEEQTFIKKGSKVPVILLSHNDQLSPEMGF